MAKKLLGDELTHAKKVGALTYPQFVRVASVTFKPIQLGNSPPHLLEAIRTAARTRPEERWQDMWWSWDDSEIEIDIVGCTNLTECMLALEKALLKYSVA